MKITLPKTELLVVLSDLFRLSNWFDIPWFDLTLLLFKILFIFELLFKFVLLLEIFEGRSELELLYELVALLPKLYV